MLSSGRVAQVEMTVQLPVQGPALVPAASLSQVMPATVLLKIVPKKACLTWVVLPWLLLKRTFNRQGLRREVSSFSSAVPLLAKRNGVVEAAFMEEWSFRNMSKLPPVPPENRSNKGPGADPKIATDDKAPPRENLKEQGPQGNIHQNTHNQGYQQDR